MHAVISIPNKYCITVSLLLYFFMVAIFPEFKTVRDFATLEMS